MRNRCEALFLCLAVWLLEPDSMARGQDDKIVKAVQAKCATTMDTDSPLRRLRVDRVTEKDGTAMVSGVMLRGGSGTYEAENQALTSGLALMLKDILPGKSLDLAGVKKYNPKDLPHLNLQKNAAASGRDEVMLSPIRFNESGMAVLNARIGSEADKAWLQDLAAKLFPEFKFKLETTLLKKRFIPSVLQQKLAEAGGNRLLVERISFQWRITEQGTGDLLDKKLVVHGFHLDGAIKNPELVKFVEQLWPELFDKPGDKPEIESKLLDTELEVPEDKLVKVLQAAVAANTVLDGVRINTGFSFDAEGKVILKGVLPSSDEKLLTELDRSLQKAATDAGMIPDRDASLTYMRVLSRGVISTRLPVVRSNLLLTDLRGWAAENVDDALLSRMHFNPDGKLTLSITTASKDAGDQVLKEFQSRATTRPYFPGIEPKEFLTNQKQFADSLTGFLRSMVEHDQKTWAGVFIERGFFRFDRDSRGIYTVSGLADSDDQPAALLRVIQEQQSNKKWSDYLGITPDRVQIDVLPLAPMVGRLKRVCPGYNAFDYIEFASVAQHPRKGLVLSGEVFSRNAKEDSAVKAAELLLKAHPQWKRRARDGVKLELAPCANQRDDSRWIRPHIAAMSLAQSDWPRAGAELSSLRRHSPESVEIWYLSAIYHHAVGDDELVRRDLTRVIMMETDKVPALGFFTNEDRRERLTLAERIQGERRDKVDRRELDLRRKIGDGASQIKLLADAE